MGQSRSLISCRPGTGSWLPCSSASTTNIGGVVLEPLSWRAAELAARWRPLRVWTSGNRAWVVLLVCVFAGGGAASALGRDPGSGALGGALLYWAAWVAARHPRNMASLTSADRLTAFSAAMAWGAVLGSGISEFASLRTALLIGSASFGLMWASLTLVITWYAEQFAAERALDQQRRTAGEEHGLKRTLAGVFLAAIDRLHWLAHPPIVLAVVTLVLAVTQVAVGLELPEPWRQVSAIAALIAATIWVSWKERANNYLSARSAQEPPSADLKTTPRDPTDPPDQTA
jgi:hypothetical protein